MAIQTAAPTVRRAPLILLIIKSWLNRPATPTAPNSAPDSEAVEAARAEILEAGNEQLSGASLKLLKNALSDFSGA